MWWQRRLWAAVAQSHRALTAILNGDPKGYEALFADREDVTLGNPFGPFASGRATVVKTLAGAAAKYREGSASVDLAAKYADDKLACIVEVENDRAKVGTSEAFVEFHVRVTSLYERIDGKLAAGASPCRSDYDAEAGGVCPSKVMSKGWSGAENLSSPRQYRRSR